MEFLTYLSSLGQTPFTEAVAKAYTTLFEGFTQATNELGRYLKSPENETNLQLVPDTQRIVRNEWLVHWTHYDKARSILRDGFRVGTNIDELCIGHLGSSMEEDETAERFQDGEFELGYNDNRYGFAYLLDDMSDNFQHTDVSDYYGDVGIVFRGSGWRPYHAGDAQFQVIFDVDEVKECFLLVPGDYAGETGDRVTSIVPCDERHRLMRNMGNFWHVLGRYRDGRPEVLFGDRSRDDSLITCAKWILERGDLNKDRMFRVGQAIPEHALTEGMTPGNLELVKYFRGFDPSGDEYSDADEDVFEEHRPHFDRWVVHSSDNAQEIYGQGFQYGADTGNLAYTDRHGKGKYAFATPIENARPPLIPESGQGITARLPYCDTIDLGGSIVFRTAGVTAYHRDDREHEVVFDRESPEGCFWIRNIHYNAWKTDTVDDFMDHLPVDAYEVIGENPGRPLCKGTYRRCIQWCRDNGDAYAHMMKRWK